ncbi:MAG TPA: hypothetical protein VM452_09780 [Caulifigura sp.]|jgi:hypothetical protein|nr:hypothetical protein [Caulifigura sp.]
MRPAAALVLCWIVSTTTVAQADRPFFRAARKQSSVPAPSLATPQRPAVPEGSITPAPTSEPQPTLAPRTDRGPAPAAPFQSPLTDAPRFSAPGVPTLKTPPLPLEPDATPKPTPAAPAFTPPAVVPFTPVPTPSSPVVAPTETITSWRATGDACLLIDVSTEYLNRFVATPRQDAGPVNDLVLGAKVEGEQTTRSTVSLRALPSQQSAKLEVLLDGETCTRTTAMTPQAAIAMSGRQRFDLQKSVEFDGRTFLTRTPATQLESCQQNLRARTGASGIPVVNSIAETIVLNQANQRQPLARQETARRVTSRVVPPFNEGIDQRLAVANDWLGRLAASTPNLHQFITSGRWMSTDRMVAGSLAGMETPSAPPPPARGGASVRIHESFAASLAAATQLNGREIPVDQLRRWISDFDSDLSGNSVGPLPSLSEPVDASIRLAESNPLQAAYQNGEIRVTLRASLRAGNTVELPVHRITIGYAIERLGGTMTLRPLPVTVVSESNELVVGSAVEKLIQTQIESRLEPVTISPTAIPAAANGVRPAVADVSSENGWLVVVFE